MLEELIIKNFALADNLKIDFTKGFNILSGETGAGKSVIIGALSFVIGEKANISSIRTGADEAEVSAILDVSTNKEAQFWLKENNISPDDGRIILRRILKKNGRSSNYIQSTPAAKNDIISFTSLLFDIHGQHEHQSLLSTENQLKLLDSYAGLEEIVSKLKRDFIELGSLHKTYQDIIKNEQKMAREADIAAFSVKEIEEAKLKPGEIETLEEEHKLLSQAEKMFGLFEVLHSTLSEVSGGALAGLRKGFHNLRTLGDIEPQFKKDAERIENAFFETEDVLDSIEKYKNNFDFSPERLSACEERLSEIHRLRKKYGNTIEEILNFMENSRSTLELANNSDEKKKILSVKITDLEKSVLALARDISQKRKEAAQKLEIAVQNNLENLGMLKAVFLIKIEQKMDDKQKPSCGSNGMDRIEFLVSPNRGEPPKKLRIIASGGETSRIMLAIKSVLAETDSVDCLVFDEIDSGIGGEVAVAVAEHIFKLSKNKQIICISHLASIAVRADSHIKVSKNIVSNRTFTEASMISGEERKVEIARMLSGDVNADVSLRHAEEMLINADKIRGVGKYCGED